MNDYFWGGGRMEEGTNNDPETLGGSVWFWPPVHELCPNYEVVEFQPRTVTPTEPRLHCYA